VVGAIAIVVVLLLFPVLFLMTGALASVIMGQTLQKDGESRFEGSELLELQD
jgi:hypothetical protein